MRSFVVSALFFVAACHYDAPPDAVRVEPETGVYRAGDTIEIRFSEPIDPATLAIRIWAGPRDIEGQVVTSKEPLLDLCYLEDAPCANTQFELDKEDPLTALVTLDPEGLGAPNTPLILEVIEGLSDAKGNPTGRPYFFDFQFLPAGGESGGEIEFQNGTYVFVSTLQEPIPGMVLTLVTDVVTDSQGRVALAGADGDEVEGAPKNTTNPMELIVDSSERGFAYFAKGVLSAFDGERFFETEPIELSVNLGPIRLVVSNLVMSAKVTTHAATGNDGLQGTMSWTALSLESGGTKTSYPAGSTPFVGVYFEPEVEPPGVPKVCGDLCGAVPLQCEPPADFPPEGLCPNNELPKGE